MRPKKVETVIIYRLQLQLIIIFNEFYFIFKYSSFYKYG